MNQSIETSTRTKDSASELYRWQARLLPFMVGSIVVTAMFFLIASLIQLMSVQSRIVDAPRPDFSEVKELLPKLKSQDQLEAVRLRVLLELEDYAITRRYHQANNYLLARVWIRYLGFVTGMSLALLGAVFILGRMREPSSKLQAEGKGLKASLETTSPGLFLSAFGVILMVTTLALRPPIEVTDVATYIGSSFQVESYEDLGMSLPPLDKTTTQKDK